MHKKSMPHTSALADTQAIHEKEGLRGGRMLKWKSVSSLCMAQTSGGSRARVSKQPRDVEGQTRVQTPCALLHAVTSIHLCVKRGAAPPFLCAVTRHLKSCKACT